MDITPDQVERMSPDSSSTSSGKKLALPHHWDNLGRNEAAIWGECHGSSLYQIRIKFPELSYKCTCPSRKFPCKHILGLLFMASGKSDAIPVTAPPEWVKEWLEKKNASEKESPQKEKKTRDPAAQEKRTQKREKSIGEGLDQLELWLSDIIRTGLGSSQLESPGFWESQAARLVDYQAPGLASRLRAMATIPGSKKDWPATMLEKLGRLALAVQAYRRLDELPQGLQADVRQIVGWTYSQEEVAASGERVRDNWVVVGQVEEHFEKLRGQRTWIVGETTGKRAYVLQFAPAKMPFGEIYLPGTSHSEEIVYWPGEYPMRAKFTEKREAAHSFKGKLSGHDTFDSFLDSVSLGLSRQPWIEHFLCIIDHVIPFLDREQGWHIQDKEGHALRLGPGEHWKLLAISGGNPVDLIGEFDGYNLTPLMVRTDKGYLET